MSDVVVAYIPVLHDGYRRFLEEHGSGRPLFVIGEDLHADYGPLAKDIRRLDPELVAAAIGAWAICSETSVLTKERAIDLAASGASIVLPAEDVSYQIVDAWFPRSPVWFDSVFLRWDKTRTVQKLRPSPARRIDAPTALDELRGAGEAAGATSIDWWRQVGAALRLTTGDLCVAHNQHQPHELSAYVVGDPRSNFHRGVHLDLTTAVHAEAALIAAAARDGLATAGSTMFVTDFPCPPCAKLIAGAGVATLYYRDGYAVLDGEEVLRSAGVEIIEVDLDATGATDATG